MIGWIFVRVACKLGGVFGYSKTKIKELYFSRQGLKIGENCAIYSDISTPEGYLITVGDHVTISNDVQFLTHDNSIDRLSAEKCDIFGEIRIGNNCFIGARSIILPGVTIGDRCIVGAGSVVTKSFPSGVIIGGNPARIIGNVEDYLRKYSEVAFGEAEYAAGKRYSIEHNPAMILKNRA